MMLYICASEMNFANLNAGFYPGHAWLEINNLTDSFVEVGYYTAHAGEYLSVGLWGNITNIEGLHEGVWYNRESNSYINGGGLLNYTRVGQLISLEELQLISDIAKQENDEYSLLGYNCCHFAMVAWNEVSAPNQKLYAALINSALRPPLILNSTISILETIDLATFSPLDVRDAIIETFPFKYETVSNLFLADTYGYYNGESMVVYNIN